MLLKILGYSLSLFVIAWAIFGLVAFGFTFATVPLALFLILEGVVGIWVIKGLDPIKKEED